MPPASSSGKKGGNSKTIPPGVASSNTASSGSTTNNKQQLLPPLSPSSSSTKRDSSRSRESSSHANANMPTSYFTNLDEQKEWLSQCDWTDRTIWVTRQLLGGNSVNGFLRATATAQRIKKQRTRQLGLTKKSSTATADSSSTSDNNNKNDPKSSSKDGGEKGGANHSMGKGAASSSASSVASKGSNSNSKQDKKSSSSYNPGSEEQMKRDIMNLRTAKKLKSELECGIEFCITLQNVIRGIVCEVDPSQALNLPPPILPDLEEFGKFSKHGSNFPIIPVGLSSPSKSAAMLPPNAASLSGTAPGGGFILPPANPIGSMSSLTSLVGSTASVQAQHQQQHHLQTPKATAAGAAPRPPPSTPKSGKASRNSSSSNTAAAGNNNNNNANANNTSPGNPNGSTLRKLRKKKFSTDKNPVPSLSEMDSMGKRIFSKKEHYFRIFEVLRFRNLKQGDYVAARVSSRDLWILARVLKSYPGNNAIPPIEFLKLSEARRDAMFREKVVIKDVEDKDENGSAHVARSLVLPLPRTYSEAAEWGTRLRKGSRVYAMYPSTTSLYSATVIDNTTYCRDDDDIIVVEFDGEEPDMTGALPKYHIPARFVTLIPREFPASQPSSAKNNVAVSAPVTSSSSSAPAVTTTITTTATTTTTTTSSNKRKAQTIATTAAAAASMPNSGGNNVPKRAKTANSQQDVIAEMLTNIDDFDASLDNFDDLDLDFSKPLDDAEDDGGDLGDFAAFEGL